MSPSSEASRSPVATLVERVLPRIKFPHLFLLLFGLFIIDFFVPDPIPFIDEIALGVLTLLVGMWRTRKEPEESAEEPLDITPPKA